MKRVATSVPSQTISKRGREAMDVDSPGSGMMTNKGQDFKISAEVVDSGGLVLMWRVEINLEIMSYSRNHIDSRIKGEADDRVWRFIGVYEEPETGKRKHTWELLRWLGSQNDLPWFCIGNFNEILSVDEKWGGSQFTWSRGIRENAIFERLDRGFGTESWSELFPASVEKHIVSTYSDHCPLLFEFMKEGIKSVKRKRHFRFENWWIPYDSCKQIIEQGWGSNEAHNVADIVEKLKHCGEALDVWNNTHVEIYNNVLKKMSRSFKSTGRKLLATIMRRHLRNVILN
ncbi:hypothetical protein DITRI_Ditri19aG0189600 [Diplodiscus trichospermus]